MFSVIKNYPAHSCTLFQFCRTTPDIDVRAQAGVRQAGLYRKQRDGSSCVVAKSWGSQHLVTGIMAPAGARRGKRFSGAATWMVCPALYISMEWKSYHTSGPLGKYTCDSVPRCQQTSPPSC